jgi:prefoldin subunit 5
MEIKTKQQQLSKQAEELNFLRDKMDKDLAEQYDKIERAQKTFQSKLNNVRSVKGEGFQESKENYEILAEIENTKNKHLLGAIA